MSLIKALNDGQTRPLDGRRVTNSDNLTAAIDSRIEQDHRRIKRRIRPRLGFKSLRSAAIILSGIVMVHMLRSQARCAFNPNLSLAEQFEILAA